MIQIIITGRNDAAKPLGEATKQVEKLGATASAQESRFSGMFSALSAGAGVAVGAIASVAVGLGAAVGVGLSFNNAIEQTSARIQAFTKDAGATADILEMVKQRAASTPFAFEEMAGAAAALLPAAKGAGVALEDLIAQAEVLAASNPAEGLEGAAFALKEALSGDFLSLVERFNLPKQRLNELKEEGVPALEAVRIAMSELGLDADLVTGLAGTLEGRWSTFMDTMTNLASIVTQPIFDTLSSGIGSVQANLDGAMPALTAFAEGLGTQIQAAIAQAQTAIPGIIDVVSGLGPVLANVGTLFAPLIDGMRQAFDGLLAIGAAVLPVLAQFWAENGASISATISTMVSTIAATLGTLYEIFGTVFQAIAGFISENQTTIVAVITVTWNTISTLIQGALSLIQGIVQSVLQLLQGDFAGAWESIKQGCAAFVQAFVTLLQGAAPGAQAAFEAVKAGITNVMASIVSSAVAFGSNIVAGVVSGVKNAASTLINAMRDLATSALNAAKSALGISSPSKVFESIIGAEIPRGAAAGVRGQTNTLVDSIKEMSTAAAAIFRPMSLGVQASALGSGGVRSSGGGSGGDTITTSNQQSIVVDARGSNMSRAELEMATRRGIDESSKRSVRRNQAVGAAVVTPDLFG